MIGRFGIALATVALLATVVMRGAGRISTETDLAPQDRPVTREEVGYVTSDSCAACHPSQYDSWHGSYHRTMTQLATPETLQGELDGLELELQGRRYRFERSSDQYWVEIIEPSGEKARRRIVMTTGSHHRQWVWFASGNARYLETIPFIHLADEQRWVPRFAAFLEPPDPNWTPRHLAGLWGSTCVNCHTTRGAMKSEHNDAATATEFGIACEACHGPAAEHVAAARNPLRRYRQYTEEEGDPTIVNPARLDHRRSSQVCGQCHAIIAAQLSYRPGDDLDRVVAPEDRLAAGPEISRWPDGMVHTGGREYDALIETACFKDGEMSCISCHGMHRQPDDARSTEEWADDQLIPTMDGDAACLACHPSGYDDEGHTHHAASSTGARCYNCHMPHTNFALLKGIRNHQVLPPSVTTTVRTGRPNACNLCHLDRSLGWTADHLERWYDIPRPTLTDDQEQIASSVLWATRGHAGQRALIAWHMGWTPAGEASGREWTVPYLTLLMNDPYPAVRLIASRAMRRLPDFDEFAFDYLAPEPQRSEALRRAVEIWNTRTSHSVRADPALLIGADGRLLQPEFVRLVGERDGRTIRWIE